MPVAPLPDRGVVKIAGEDARSFLQNLMTCDMTPISEEKAGYGALLTPQGKIIADAIILEVPPEDGGGFLLDVNLAPMPELIRKLGLFRLRAKVTIDDLTPLLSVLAIWGDSILDEGEAFILTDPRLPALGSRAILPREVAERHVSATAEAYHAHRIALGMPEGAKDFAYGETFPHEALMDQTGGVSFTKGCYVGQEVVSRMQHRGSARTRLVPVSFPGGVLPEAGAAAMAGEKTLGTIGSCAEGRGLALLRLDRVAEAVAEGLPLTAGGVAFTAGKAEWTSF